MVKSPNMWGKNKPEWGLLSLRGCGGSRAPESQPMKPEEGRLSVTKVTSDWKGLYLYHEVL